MDDLIQETFLRCVEGQERFRGASSFKTYLFGIATHVLYEDIRRRMVSDRNFVVGVTSVLDTAESPSAYAAARQQWDLLSSALTQIPFEQQVAIELHYLHELRAPEIAEALAIPEGTVRSRLRLGLIRLREQLENTAPSEAEALMRRLEVRGT